MADKKVLFSYSVTRYEDGSVDVADLEKEETEKLSADDIYKDIEDVARLVSLKRAADTAFTAAYNGVAKFFQDVNAQQKAAAQPTTVTKETK
jgi:hypothetical protein